MEFRYLAAIFSLSHYNFLHIFTSCAKVLVSDVRCIKSVRIPSYSGPYFPAFGLKTDQNNSEYGHFLRSGYISLGYNAT